jgi:hypothetical protein
MVTGQPSAASFLKGFAFGPKQPQTAGGKSYRYTYPVKYLTYKASICTCWIMILLPSQIAPWASSATFPFERLTAEGRTSQKFSGAIP